MEIQFSPWLYTLAQYLGAILCFSLVVFCISLLVYGSFLCAKGIVKLANLVVISPDDNKKGDD